MICDSGLSFVSGNYGPCDCFWSFCHDVTVFGLFVMMSEMIIIFSDR